MVHGGTVSEWIFDGPSHMSCWAVTLVHLSYGAKAVLYAPVARDVISLGPWAIGITKGIIHPFVTHQ